MTILWVALMSSWKSLSNTSEGASSFVLTIYNSLSLNARLVGREIKGRMWFFLSFSVVFKNQKEDLPSGFSHARAEVLSKKHVIIPNHPHTHQKMKGRRCYLSLPNYSLLYHFVIFFFSQRKQLPWLPPELGSNKWLLCFFRRHQWSIHESWSCFRLNQKKRKGEVVNDPKDSPHKGWWGHLMWLWSATKSLDAKSY